MLTDDVGQSPSFSSPRLHEAFESSSSNACAFVNNLHPLPYPHHDGGDKGGYGERGMVWIREAMITIAYLIHTILIPLIRTIFIIRQASSTTSPSCWIHYMPSPHHLIILLTSECAIYFCRHRCIHTPARSSSLPHHHRLRDRRSSRPGHRRLRDRTVNVLVPSRRREGPSVKCEVDKQEKPR